MPPDADISPDEAPEPRRAATIILMRDTDTEPEILMLRRHARSGFAASLWVFPGGVVDLADGRVDPDLWQGIDPTALTDRFGLPAEVVLAMHVAAVRETFEEAGVLLAHHADGSVPDTLAAAFVAMRKELNDREVAADWLGFLREQQLVLDLDALTYHSRWITPIQEPRRYDTCFFIAQMPDGGTASSDHVETTDDRWISARAALEDDEVKMIFPTVRTLEALAGTDSVAAAVKAAEAQPAIPVIQPHLVLDPDGTFRRILVPGDEEYPHEVYR